MKIAITGSSGFIGKALVAALKAKGHDVLRIVRKSSGAADEALWDPEKGYIDSAALEGSEAVIHLAGIGIADKRWTASYKKKILESRTLGTSLLASALAGLKQKPKVLVSASAIGYYGNRGDEPLDESRAAGTDYLAGVVQAWEEAAAPARAAGIRVVHPRTGLVLGKDGGALAKMLLPFKMGAGGNMGSGTQYYSWITLQDEVEALIFLATSADAQGVYNLTAPNPVTNAEYTKALGAQLHRPTVFPMPALIAKLAFGEMAEALILGGQRVLPKRLQASGFKFSAPDIHSAFAQVLE